MLVLVLQPLPHTPKLLLTPTENNHVKVALGFSTVQPTCLSTVLNFMDTLTCQHLYLTGNPALS